jgi:mRNA-degrading endonuclease RelE of RelBE toxin-antitoxin system
MPPYRIEWLDEAQSGCGGGRVMPLHGDMAGAFRLRLGDYRVLFTLEADTMRIFGVRHRSEAYSR